jgi:hypothetical protein
MAERAGAHHLVMEQRGRRRIALDVVLGLVGVAWLIVPLALLYGAVLAQFRYMDEAPPPSFRRATEIAVWGGVGLAAVLPVLGLALARVAGRPRVVVAFGVALVVTLGIVGWATI